MADIVDDFLTRLQQHVPSLPLETRLTLEKETRQAWGGDRVEVGKGINGLGKFTRTWLVAQGLRQTKSLKDCFEQAGVSRRTGYRILARK